MFQKALRNIARNINFIPLVEVVILIVCSMTKEKRTDKLLVTTSQCALGCYDIIITVARILYHNSLSFVKRQIVRIYHLFPC